MIKQLFYILPKQFWVDKRSLAPARTTRQGAKHSAKNALRSPNSHFRGDPVTKGKLMAPFMLLQMDVGLRIEQSSFSSVSSDYWCTTFVDKYINILVCLSEFSCSSTCQVLLIFSTVWIYSTARAFIRKVSVKSQMDYLKAPMWKNIKAVHRAEKNPQYV